MKTKDVIYSLIVGITGASIGGLWALLFSNLYGSFDFWFGFKLYCSGIIPGFIVCSLLSLWYLHLVKVKYLNYQKYLKILIGVGFGGLAGIISGYITGILWCANDFGGFSFGLDEYLLGFGTGGAIIGVVTGIIASLFISLVASSFIPLPPPNIPKNE